MFTKSLSPEQQQEFLQAEKRIESAALALSHTKDLRKLTDDKANSKAKEAQKDTMPDRVKSITLLPSKEKQERVQAMERAKIKVKAATKMMRGGSLLHLADKNQEVALPDHGLRQAALADAPDVLALPQDNYQLQQNGVDVDAHLGQDSEAEVSPGPRGGSTTASTPLAKYASNSGRTREDMEQDWEAAQKASFANLPAPAPPKPPVVMGRTLRPEKNKASPGRLRHTVNQQRSVSSFIGGINESIAEESSGPKALPSVPQS